MSELYLPSTDGLNLPATSYQLSRAAAERYAQLTAAQEARSVTLSGGGVQRRRVRGRSRARPTGRTVGTRSSR